MQRQLIAFGVLLLLGVGGLYVAYPDTGNDKIPEQPPITSELAIETVATTAVPAPLVVPPPIIEPRVIAVPAAQTTFVEGQGEASCSVPPTEAVTTSVEQSIYRWTDASGKIHFSDKKPASSAAEIYNAEQPAELDYFDLTINYRGQNIVPFLHDQLNAQATSIYKIMSDFVGSDKLRHVKLDIVMFPDAESFHQYAAVSTGNNNPNTGGYYSTLTNEAVTYTYPDDARTMEVARHESTHVIAMGIMGKMPLWLNEGLAEYFSKLGVRSQFSQVGVHKEWLQLARATVESGYPNRFAEFLKLEPDGWRNANEANHYALAWSLVYYMLGTAQGKQALGKMMRQMAEQYCQPLDSAEALARSYPGGLNALEKELRAWLADDAVKAPHTY